MIDWFMMKIKGNMFAPIVGGDRFTVSVLGTFEAEVDSSKCLNLVEDDMNHDTEGTNNDIIFCAGCEAEFSKAINDLME